MHFILTILPIFLLCILLFILITFFKEQRTIFLEKRFASFSLLSNKVTEISFFDTLQINGKKRIQRFAKILKYSKVLNDYAKGYEKYIAFEEKETKESMEFIAIKFLTAILFLFLNSVAFFFKQTPLNILTLCISFCTGFFVPDILWNIKRKKRQHLMEEEL